MSRVVRVVMSLALVAIFTASAFAQDEAKKPRKKPQRQDPAASILKRLEKAELTEEQVAKVKAIVAKMGKDTVTARKAAQLTPEQREARMAAMKKAKEEGKTGKELAAAVQAAAKLSPEQEQAMKQAKEAQAAMMKEITSLLTPEQRKAIGRGAKPKRNAADRPADKPKQRKKKQD